MNVAPVRMWTEGLEEEGEDAVGRFFGSVWTGDRNVRCRSGLMDDVMS